ncbi:hypothetical protein [Metabacillus niabensis]|uniref:hypothetical protein n=1 Tax=Metabacillus niabensis TaxID=324854 RepID=UPI0039A37168
MFFVLVLADSVYASENDLNLDLTKATITYEDYEIIVGSFGNDPEIAKQIEESLTSVTSEEQSLVTPVDQSLITPFKTVTGAGGKVTIDAGTSGRIIYWSVTPATSWPWIFTGDIQLRYYSGYKRDAAIVGAGGLGSSASGYVTMKKNNGGIATLVGTAYSTDNKNYKVMPGASVPFRAN